MHDNSPQPSTAPTPLPQTAHSTDPDIDVIIAVHSRTRPVRRAIESCRVGRTGPVVRITVVCHNLPVKDIQSSIGFIAGVDLRFLHLDDGIPSPAGPKNAGLDAATGGYLCMLDSDDYLEEGALELWHRKITAEQADAVIAPVRHENGAIIKTPRARTGRTADLDPVKDGLAYATSMRGLWRNNMEGSPKFRYVAGLLTGEDLTPGLQLYFSGAKFIFPKHGPAYVLGNIAGDRVTAAVLPLAEEFKAIAALPEEWLRNLSERQRQSIASKVARTSLIGAIRRRGPGHEWGKTELAAIQDTARMLEAMAPAYRRGLTAADNKLLANALAAGSGDGRFQLALKKYQGANLWSRFFAGNLRGNLDPESQLRQLVRAMFDRRS